MRWALLVFPLLSPLCGCHVLTRDAEVIEYRPGGAATTTVAKADAEYRLSAPGARQSWIQTDVLKGSAVGFRRGSDGAVVAFAGVQTWQINDSDGRHAWLCTPKPATAWDRLVVSTRDKSENALSSVMLIATAPIWLTQCAVNGEWP